MPPLIGGLFDHAWIAFAMSWAGMLFDLTIPFWLIWRKSRLPAYLAVIGFHVLTGLLFNIGMFPWIMMACTLVFFEWRLGPERRTENGKRKTDYGLGHAFLLLFFLVQLVLPLRHWLISGDVNWTEQGGRFAWRVMLVEKTGTLPFLWRI